MYSIKLASYTAVEDITMPGQPFNATLVMVANEWWETDNHSMLLQKAVSESDGLATSAGPVQTKAVVKWNFSNSSCADAQSSDDFGCLSYNSYCHDHWTGESSGHICRCSNGYEGNPYIPNGCQGMQLIIHKEKKRVPDSLHHQIKKIKSSSSSMPTLLTGACFISAVCIATDIDECAHPDIYQCLGHCINTDGSYNCICPHGTSGDPQKPHGCIKATEKFSGNKISH